MHPALEVPVDTSQKLWRYFKTERFIEFLRTGQLYFASARQFADPFEGAVAVLPHDFPTDPRYADPLEFESPWESLRDLIKVSCWHRADYESNAMWELYAGASKGVAITTNPNRIEAAVRPFKLQANYGAETLWYGDVQYVDLTKERLRVGDVKRFWYKHLAFAWEREYRLGISLVQASEWVPDVPELGIKVDFSVGDLIDRIVLGPALAKDEIDAIRDAVQAAGIEGRIDVSSMLGRPRYL